MAPHIMSRWAPASEPPMTVRWSCHASARAAQSASPSPIAGGPQPGAQLVGHHDVEQHVEGRRRRPARRRSRRRATLVARAFAGGERLGHLEDRSSWPAPAAARPPGELAPSSSRRRTSGSRSAGIRSGTGSDMTSRHPGSASRTKPVWNDSRIRIGCGSVRATTRPPRSAAWSEAASWCREPSGFRALTPSTFQLTGRSAARDSAASRSTLVVAEAG